MTQSSHAHPQLYKEFFVLLCFVTQKWDQVNWPLNPLQVRIKFIHCRVIHLVKNISICIQGNMDICVAHPFLEYYRLNPGLDASGCKSMS